jgi:hypothetical protein
MADDPIHPEPEAPMDELLMAIMQLLEKGRMLPALMLLYNAIDIYANLARPEGSEEASEEDFKLWVKNYLLPRAGLPCTAEDLYAAKISLARHLSPELPESRRGKARAVMYEPGEENDLEKTFELAGMSDRYVAVPVGKLLTAFVHAMSDFEFDCESDPARQRLLEERVGRFYSSAPTSKLEQIASLMQDMKTQAPLVQSFEEFLQRVRQGPVTVVATRSDSNDLFYLLVGKETSTGGLLNHIWEVRDPALHGDKDLERLKKALKEASLEYRLVDYSDKTFGEEDK